MPSPDYKTFTDIKFGIDSRGRLFFTGRYPNGRVMRIAMRDAMYNGKPTEGGVEFSPGYVLPYGEIDPINLAENLYTGSRIERLLSSEEPLRKVFVIFKNGYYQRIYYDHYPTPPYSRISDYGINVMWHVEGSKHQYTHDIRERELGKPPYLDFIFSVMMKIFSYELYGKSDEVVYVDGAVGLLDPYVQGSNLITTRPDKVIIDNLAFFRDTIVAVYPLRRLVRSNKNG